MKVFIWFFIVLEIFNILGRSKFMLTVKYPRFSLTDFTTDFTVTIASFGIIIWGLYLLYG